MAVAVESSSAVDVDIVSSKLEERSHILEDEFERIGLPVGCVVSELDVALNIYRVLVVSAAKLEIKGHTDINMFQESQV